jgi:hypothetical protein
MHITTLLLVHSFGLPDGSISWAEMSKTILKVIARRGLELGRAQGAAAAAAALG